MNAQKPQVIVTRKLPDAIETRMMELFDTRLNLDDAPMSKAALIDAVQSADVLTPTVTDIIDRDIIQAAGDQLKIIASFGTGVDHIDLNAAKERNITVTNMPGVLTEGERRVRSGEWTGWSPVSMLGHRISGKRLGIIGMGRIGQAVARRARGFGLSIHYHNRKPVHGDIERDLEATYWESLDQMLSRMDIISVNCPHTPATYHLLSRRRLQLLKPDSYVVNTSRGEVIDEGALTALLADKQIAGAALDVYEHEPAINPKLLTLDNVILLPHMGSATIEGRLAMGEKVIINIKTFIDGHTPPDRVLETMF